MGPWIFFIIFEEEKKEEEKEEEEVDEEEKEGGLQITKLMIRFVAVSLIRRRRIFFSNRNKFVSLLPENIERKRLFW